MYLPQLYFSYMPYPFQQNRRQYRQHYIGGLKNAAQNERIYNERRFCLQNAGILQSWKNQGEKIVNLLANSKVCFEIDEYIALQADNLKSPCDANAEFESVIIRGDAKIIEDFDIKRPFLQK